MMTKTKLDRIIKNGIDYGRLPKGISLVDFYCLYDGAKALKEGKNFEFISFSVKKIFESCELTVKERGIGWVVSC